MRARMALAAAALVITGAAAPGSGDDAALAKAEYRAEIETWRAEREARLVSEYGWLSVSGLSWLFPGEVTVGSAPGSDFALPAGAPARAGVIERRGDQVTMRVADGVSVSLQDHPLSNPLVLPVNGAAVEIGRLRLQLIRRGDRLGLRLRDPDSARRRAFKGLRWFPVDPAYRVTAAFHAYDAPRPLRIDNVLGQTSEDMSPGYALFDLGGKTIRLHAVYEDGETSQLFFVFKDKTAPGQTYGGGRTLYADLPQNGRVVLDFNKAYSPPCAFVPYTTCPLPPKENRMPVAVRAGELKYEGAH
jgi:uncharacterized protein (DUF1684 family)